MGCLPGATQRTSQRSSALSSLCEVPAHDPAPSASVPAWQDFGNAVRRGENRFTPSFNKINLNCPGSVVPRPGIYWNNGVCPPEGPTIKQLVYCGNTYADGA
jgi:hypothetical protein